MRGTYEMPTDRVGAVITKAERLGYHVQLEQLGNEGEQTRVIITASPDEDQLCEVCEENVVEPGRGHCALARCIAEYFKP